jgi:hypothetical protein
MNIDNIMRFPIYEIFKLKDFIIIIFKDKKGSTKKRDNIIILFLSISITTSSRSISNYSDSSQDSKLYDLCCLFIYEFM